MRFISAIQNSGHVKHAVVEDLDGNLLFGEFTCSVAENDYCYRIMSEARGGRSLWIPTLDPIALGFAPTQDPALFDFYDSVL